MLTWYLNSLEAPVFAINNHILEPRANSATYRQFLERLLSVAACLSLNLASH